MKSINKKWKGLQSALNEQEFLGTPANTVLLRFLYGAALVLLITWMLPSQRPFEYGNLVVGSIAPEEIIAPFKFAIRKGDDKLEQEREEVRRNVPPVFDKMNEVPKVQNLTLTQFFADLQQYFKKNRTLLQTQQSDSSSAVADSFLVQFNLKYNAKIQPGDLRQLLRIYEDKGLPRLSKHLLDGLEATYKIGILNLPGDDVSKERIAIAENGIEEVLKREEVLEIEQAREIILNNLKKRYLPETTEMEIADYLISIFLVPNLNYNEEITLERKDKAEHDVPLTRGYIEKNERIVDSHEIVTESVYRKLQSLANELQERAGQQQGLPKLLFNLGKFLFALVLVLLTALYIYFYRNSIFTDDRLLGMITLIFVFQLLAAALILGIPGWPHLSIPVVIAPMLLAMLLDFGVAFICTVLLSLVLGASLGNDYTFMTMTLVVGSVAAFSVQKIRNRSHMFRAILLVLLAYLAVDLLFGLMQSDSMQQVFSDFGKYMLPNAVLGPTVVFFLIGIFERLFDVSTDITLLELSDLNHDLMKKLSVEAPGTFHHSIVVSNLAEAAAVAINSNALLTRVGCYFHDIGKMLKAEYFVENQSAGVNKHDNLTPHMSCLILINHVKAGLELAEKHGLPYAVRQFIAEHHGTSLISYFYHKALENADPKDISKSDFRYPGPKPKSKETAISMLADTVEAASRTLNNPTPQRIRNLVDTLVEHKIKENQLEDCNLTLNEISKIKDSFIPILTGIHHNRIEYPGETSDKDKKGQRDKNASRPQNRNGDKKKPESTGKAAL